MEINISQPDSRRLLTVNADESISIEKLTESVVDRLNLKVFDPKLIRFQRYQLYLIQDGEETLLDPKGELRVNLQGGETLVIRGFGVDNPITNTEYALASLYLQGSWSIEKLNQFLSNLEQSYKAIFVYNSVLIDLEQARRESYSRPSLSRLHEEIQSNMREDEKLLIHRISISSPGFLEVIGALNPLETVRQYLHDRHQAKIDERKLHSEEKKDDAYRTAVEKAKALLEVESLKTKVAKERIALLKDAGFPQDEIRPYVEQYLKTPLDKLATYQDRGDLEFAEIVPIGVRQVQVVKDVDKNRDSIISLPPAPD